MSLSSEEKNTAYEKLTPQRKQLVDKVMENLEKGNLFWMQGWISSGAPESAITGKKYRGINNLFLSLIAMSENYGDNRWATFKQMEEKGWTFKKDEEGKSAAKGKGATVEYYEMRDKETKKRFDRSVLDGMTASEQQEYMDKNVYLLRKFYRVFNCSLMDGVPAKEKPLIDINDRNERAEAILSYWDQNESKIVYGGSQAYYKASNDEVHLPNISYNYNECILRTTNIIKRRRRIGVNNEGQLVPLRIYNSQLMDYYNQGVAADTAFSQYLAFYHILEFFFQTVIEEDTLNYITDTLTKPSFSAFSKRELTSFVKGIKKKLSNQKEKSSQGEQFALELCLEKHLNISDLTARLNLIDCECVDYYKGNKVSFAQDSIEVDFENEKTVISRLSQRIYSVRNAIVHSKDCDKLRYQPFDNDDELSKEIPLIKSIAEIVIINTAEIAK